MQTKSVKIKEILIAILLCLVLFLPCLFGMYMPIYAVLVLLVIAPLLSYISSYRPYTVAITLSVLVASLSVFAKSPVPIIGMVLLLPSVLTAGYHIKKETAIYSTLLYVFYALLAATSLLMLSAKLFYDTDVITLVAENLPSMFGRMSDYTNSYILMFDYAREGVTLEQYSAFLEKIAAFDSAALYQQAVPIVRNALTDFGLYVLLGFSVVWSVYNAVIASLISSSKLASTPFFNKMGFSKRANVLPLLSAWYLPRKHGKIAVAIFLVSGLALLLGVSYAAVPLVLLAVVFILVGTSTEWFIVKLMTKSRGLAIFLFLALLLCTNFIILLILGILDSLTQFRRRYNDFMKSKNSAKDDTNRS